MNVEVLWQKFLDNIKNELSSLAFDTWFKSSKLYKIENGIAIIIVPMQIHKKHMEDNYLEQIKEIFNRITETNFEIEFLLEEEVEKLEKKAQEIKSEQIPAGIPKMSREQSNLKPEYTFDNFIVGNSNKFAHAAALSVAENPGKMYNPLFLYGNSGLGKTHLMHAIGNYISQNSNRRVLYVSSNDFINDFVKIQRKSQKDNNMDNMDFFKSKYRDIDVLIIDDIQYLGGANATQQEFFHTFNTLYSDSKQIIISSDKSPDDLQKLEDRLKTRFCWGLTVNIFPPDYNLKVEILRKKIISGNIEQKINDDVIEYMASNIGSDVRHLEGAMTRLVAYSAMMGGAEINLDLAIEALKDFISNGICEKDDIHRIQKVVAEEFQISVEDMRSKKRNANIAYPRQIAMYLCRKLTSESFPKIGTDFGGKDHSTVMFSVEKIEKEMKENPDLVKTINKCIERIEK
ncbi:MAG: chromosomal replication initiator protein DnaA [Bacilli bacterium]|nr:chromosomal replication initiator protein DnaA [Bacilli bacterium]